MEAPVEVRADGCLLYTSQKEERRNVRDELEKIANGSLSEKYEREITNVSDYKKLGIDYCNENDVPMTEIWEFD